MQIHEGGQTHIYFCFDKIITKYIKKIILSHLIFYIYSPQYIVPLT